MGYFRIYMILASAEAMRQDVLDQMDRGQAIVHTIMITLQGH